MPYISGAIQHCLKPAETLSGIETNVMPETHLEKGRFKPAETLSGIETATVGGAVPPYGLSKYPLKKVAKATLTVEIGSIKNFSD